METQNHNPVQLTTSPETASERPRPPPSRRRDKPQLSCNLCRRRKLRCDRKQPCSVCSSRHLPCTYAAEKGSSASSMSKPSPAASVHDRLVHLERLVMSLRPDSGVAEAILPDSPVPKAVDDNPLDGHSECGSMRVSSSELHYVGGDHWATILDSIADLKDHFDREEQFRLANTPEGGVESGNVLPKSHALLLYSCCQPASSRAEILAALPPKPAVDRYISRYFNRLDLVSSSAVHGPSFLREYDAFWNNQSGVPIIWVGLLFSMICLAVMTSDASESSLASNEADQQSLQVDLYRQKTVQCLVMGEYTKSGPYVLETIIHYVYAEFCIRTDADKDIWFLLALEVNLAMRMGYHRDPSHFPGISPLQGEMRRRLWATVLMGDILISSQMGMPRMVSHGQCDTAEPRNLNDADLDDSSTVLPPPRPETEHTTALGVIARRRMVVALGLISDLTNAVKPCSYAEVMRVDGILQEAADSLPPPLKTKPMTSSVTDSPQLIMSRLFIRHMLYKGQIMLHRRFLYLESPSRDQDTFAYSRNACLDASLGSLEIQQILDEETCPGGQLHMMRWRVTSIMNHQFLTATMILCSLMYRGQTLERVEDITTALRQARTIWMRRSCSSNEAKKAADTVSIVLARAGDGRGRDSSMNSEYTGTTEAPSTGISGSDSSTGIGVKMFQDTMSPSEADKFVMPDLLGTFTSSNQQGQPFTFDANAMERGSGMNEWMLMNFPELVDGNGSPDFHPPF